MEMKTVIIGGGSAGLFCAVAIKKLNSSINVTIIEKQQRVLKKLLAAGNGRCNFTNINASVSNYYGANPEFVVDALKLFSSQDALDFFGLLGILTKTEKDGKCYPYSMQSSVVVDALRLEAERLQIIIKSDFEAENIKRKNGQYCITGKKGSCIYAQKIVLACGGAASPDLGGSESVYGLLTGFSSKYSVEPVSPVLVQVKTEKSIIYGLQGIKIDANVSFYSGSKKLSEQYGDLLFTEYGLSGNTIFALSVYCHLYKDIKAVIDFMPEYEHDRVIKLLTERRKTLAHMTSEFFLSGVINKKAGMAIVKFCGVEKLTVGIGEITDSQIKKLAGLLKGFTAEITGTAGFKNAQVTAGGIATNAFNCSTMESKYDKGLYVIGEMLDIYGDCGGYNLQWAWSSGYTAAAHISRQPVMKND